MIFYLDHFAICIQFLLRFVEYYDYLIIIVFISFHELFNSQHM